jgi:hypothetical protein
MNRGGRGKDYQQNGRGMQKLMQNKRERSPCTPKTILVHLPPNHLYPSKSSLLPLSI